MKQSLQLRMGQQLTMTPQLQQAIRLLQLSSLDLQQEVQDALDSNFMLEIDESQQATSDSNEDNNYTDPTIESSASNDVSEISSESSDISDKASEQSLDQSSELSQQVDEAISSHSDTDNIDTNVDSADSQVNFEENQNTIPTELPTDTDWDEVFENNNVHSAVSAVQYSGAETDIFENTGNPDENIQEHLLRQVELMRWSDEDFAIAQVIIDSIDDNGYLSASIDELLENFIQFDDIEEEEIKAVLRQIQHLDPPGVAARDLQENLLIQMDLMDEDTPWLKEAKLLVDRYLHLLANRDFNSLKRRLKLKEDAIIEVIKLIKSFNPRPAGQVTNQNLQYITPDVIVKKINGIWRAELNGDLVPPLAINQQYMQLSKDIKNKAEASTVKENIQEAKWFIKSVQSRHETLLKVARCILDFQQDFFNYGDEYMKALVLADVADKVGMHESTISRVTTQKYMHTPKGIFELKYFFSSHVSTSSGGEASATAIRAVIRKIIDSESKQKPYSDNKLSQLLEQQNYKVARRTVAKYRESLSIPPSNERKTLA